MEYIETMSGDLKSKIALVIWWCEGTKLRKDKRWKSSYIHAIEVTNSNPRIVKLFLDYLTTTLGVNKDAVKGQLQIHVGDDKEKAEKYWSEKMCIPIRQFNKTIVRKIGNKPYKNMGTFKVRIYGKALFQKLTDNLNSLLAEINIGE